ncbi:Flagellar regulatory protein FleQ [Methylomonas albis]|uniref:Sigma-54-dependent Fis family transcriptional regulator n=1 Tax=Methylomonas albis TaxID=1854563 RepID=A0ABR9D1I8_9GAMM|nr:sigma-54 dependent transcriptional regulator [Methylomonas albis]MBD9355777.1 sigma-54-dependent Fis family transcriptional regulator [Methylomonas albis]CAD6878798.1 Flagellar regulatory protein FleQ [Methylomonas albis]
MALPEILLIDDNTNRIQQVEGILRFLEYRVETVASSDFEAVLRQHDNFDAVFVGCGGDKQASLIKMVAENVGDIPVVLLVEAGGPQVVSAIQQMVNKTLEWPTVYPQLIQLLDSLPQPVQSTKKSLPDKGLAGKSKAIQKTRSQIDQVAKSDATVLILGESGTGKEVVAQALHRASSRRDRPFVPVNCGAIPGELLESELFGHEKGAFTGALTSRQGRFEMAEGGTLFLDEIGDMPMPMQVKLLRVLQERTFERVGSNKTIHCDVRIIAATHRYLEQEIAEKRFREDLFYRLNVFPIEVPALRERAEDIPYLINDLVARMETANRGTVSLLPRAIATLMQHSWPGNVRELSNLIERLAIISPDASVDVGDLPEKFQAYEVPEGVQISLPEQDIHIVRPAEREALAMPAPGAVAAVHLPEQGIDLKEYLTDLENELIRQALEECNGVVAHAAKLLNMRRTTLVEKLRKSDVA